MRLIRLSARAAMLAFAMTLALPFAGAVPAQQAIARPMPDSFADIAAKLLPAVVNISSTQAVQARAGQPGAGPEIPMFPPGSPFEQFFKDFLNRNRPGQRGDNQPTPPERRMQSLGSGFIIDASGLVVTNNHVIDGADEITVTLQDNTALKAKVLGRDESGDIALLQVKPDKPLPALQFGDSDKERVGDWVLAIGNPFGLGGSVTAGIVSARGRDIHQGPYDDFIQTDAAINRGNSGGPLFNMDGEVIGMNTAIYSPSGGSIGIGFSIPANLVKAVVAQLKDFGHPRRGWLGVRIQQVTPDIAESLGLKDANGAMVAGVNDGGPADKARIRNGDIILKFNNQDVKEMRTLPRIVADSEVGKQVPVLLWRDGKEVTVQATLDEKPDDIQKAAATTGGDKTQAQKPTEISGLGVKIAPITQETKDKFSLGGDQKGVVITDVAPNSSASERGLKPGDVIVEVQQGEVSTPADVQQKVETVKKENRKSVLMLIQRQDGLQWVPLSLSGDKDKQPG
jgi:serine protease Do